MRTRLLALLTAALLAVGVGLADPTPALAADGGDCSANSFCLYQWMDLGAPVAGKRWQSSLQNIYNHSGHCLSIPPATWANGDNVSDNSGSLEWYFDRDLWGSAAIAVYNWTGCNPGGGSFYISNNNPGPISGGAIFNLSDYYYPQTSISLYHTITSISVTF